jgi:fumarylacetoacetase
VTPGGDGGFGVPNLPFGAADGRLWVRYSDYALDLRGAVARGLLDERLAAATLNPFLAGGRALWTETRARLASFVVGSDLLVPIDQLVMTMPFEVADYVDFYASENHATNLGRIFRPGAEPLLPNWKHLPVGYHGRAGTVVVSGTDLVRPSGQLGAGRFGPSQRLDVEAEVGFVVGVPSPPGRPVPIGRFRDHVFGIVLVNDWSARDIQGFEYQPLGPFLGKSFATSISPWVVPLDALAAAVVPAVPQDPPVQPYLRGAGTAYDLRLSIAWNGVEVSRPQFRGMYWQADQMLAHLTINGAHLRTGDLYASGTVSGPVQAETGSFIELTGNGTRPVELGDGQTRTFLADGDTVTISGHAPGRAGTVVGLGEVSGTVRAGR